MALKRLHSQEHLAEFEREAAMLRCEPRCFSLSFFISLVSLSLSLSHTRTLSLSLASTPSSSLLFPSYLSLLFLVVHRRLSTSLPAQIVAAPLYRELPRHLQ